MKDLYQIIHIIGAMQGLFLFLLLVMRKENKTANKILAVLMLFISINLTLSFFHTNNAAIMDIPAIARSDLFLFSYGPFLLLYTEFLTGMRKRVTIKQLLHFLPSCALLILLLLYSVSRFQVSPSGLWDESEPAAVRFWYVLHPAALIQMSGYMLYSLFALYRYKSKLNAYFSNTGRIYLLWLRILLSGITFIGIVAIIQFVLYSFFNPESLLQWIISSSSVIMVFVIGYFMNRQPDILKDLEAACVLERISAGSADLDCNPDRVSESPAEENTKYKKNRLGEEEEREYLGRLLRFMESEKPYLEPELNLRQLSELTGIPSYLLSMLISLHLNRNFYTFVNGYRVEEAKKRLSSDSGKEFNILTIAYDSGFNSKSTFNTVFRKFEGVTPSQFRSGQGMVRPEQSGR